MKKFLPYGRQSIDDQDIKAVLDVLKTDWITQGPKIEQFEKTIAKYCSAKYAVAMNNGTAALQAAYAAAGIKSGDEVIITPLTFAATANALVHLGAKPVFADIQEDNLSIDPVEIEKKITPKTKAIVCVDFAGHPSDLDEIGQTAEKYNLLVIQDAAHSLGAEYRGYKVGQKIGQAKFLTVFSFHPVKLLACGEGGMVLTNHQDFYEALKALRHHGINKKPEKGGWYYEIEKPGYNFRLTDFQCALGLSQFRKINGFLKRRREIAQQYNQAFAGIEAIITPQERAYVKSAWHIYPIQLKNMDRRKTFAVLRANGIGVQVHYMPVHLHPFYRNKFGYKQGDFPAAEKYYERAITLPLFPSMTEKDIGRVIKTVKNTAL